MPYCEVDDVRSVVNTSLTPEQIGNLITRADALVDQKLGGYTLTDELKGLVSMLLTATIVSIRDPRSYAVGIAKVQYGNQIAGWSSIVDEIIKGARATRASGKIVSSAYQKINEDARYKNEPE